MSLMFKLGEMDYVQAMDYSAGPLKTTDLFFHMEHAAQAAGAEFQIAVKAVRDGVAVARDGDELGFDGVVQIRLGKPAVIEIVCIVHGVSPLSSLGSCGQPQAARLSIILHFYRFCKYQIFVGTGFSGQPCQTPFIASASLSASAGASELANRLP